MIVCDECGGGPVVPNPDGRGELVCTKCSIVVQHGIIDATPTTQRDDQYLGVGGDGHGPGLVAPTPQAMTTRPTAVTRDASGRALDQATAQRQKYLTKVDSRVVSNKDRSARRLQIAVRDLAARLKVSPEIEGRAFLVARKAISARMFRGWEFGLVAGGAVYFALLEASGSVDEKALLPHVRASHEKKRRSNVFAVYKGIKRLLGAQPEITSAADLARKIAVRLGLSGEVLRLIKQNVALIPPTAIPRIDAAAVVYLSCVQGGVKISQRRVAEACGTNDVSLRQRLQSTKPSNTPTAMNRCNG